MGSMTNLVYYAKVIWWNRCVAQWRTNDIRSSDHDLERKIPPVHSQFTYTIDQRIFVVLKDVVLKNDCATFCAVVDEALGKGEALRFLNEVRNEFKRLLRILDLGGEHSAFDMMDLITTLRLRSAELLNRLVEPLVGFPQRQPVDIQPSELQKDDLLLTLRTPANGFVPFGYSLHSAIRQMKNAMSVLTEMLVLERFNLPRKLDLEERIFDEVSPTVVWHICIASKLMKGLGGSFTLKAQKCREFMEPIVNGNSESEALDFDRVGFAVFPGFQLHDTMVLKCEYYPLVCEPIAVPKGSSLMRVHSGCKTIVERSSQEFQISSSETRTHSGYRTNPEWSSQEFSHGSSSSSTSVGDSEPSAAPIVDDYESSPARAKPNDCTLEDVVKKCTWNRVLQMTGGLSSRHLGQGVFGTVYLGKLETRREVAVKVLNQSSHQGIPEYLNEINRHVPHNWPSERFK